MTNKVTETDQKSVLEQAQKSLPTLQYAVALQQAASSIGFDWPDSTGVIAKIREELDEVTAEINSADQARLQDEIGDLLFAVTNLARHLDVDPQQALQQSIEKFQRRFYYIEHTLANQGRDPQSCDLQTLDELWDEAKANETGRTNIQKSRR